MERAEVPGMIREQRLSRWIEEYSDSILHTCFLYLSDQGQAEDATQDIRDENSMDDDREESGVLTLTLSPVYSGEERILCSTQPVSLESVGAQIDLIRLIVLPAEIQYQISYSITDPQKYHSVMDDESHSITKSLSFRFVELNAGGTVSRYLKEGISDPVGCIGDHVIIGYLGVSELYDEYTLAVYENPLGNPLEFVTVKVQYENNLTWTPEERVWQQGSDRTKPHNEADDTLVNPTSDDLPEVEAVAIAKEAVLRVLPMLVLNTEGGSFSFRYSRKVLILM